MLNMQKGLHHTYKTTYEPEYVIPKPTPKS